jgi:hypothetical protein
VINQRFTLRRVLFGLLIARPNSDAVYFSRPSPSQVPNDGYRRWTPRLSRRVTLNINRPISRVDCEQRFEQTEHRVGVERRVGLGAKKNKRRQRDSSSC